MTSSVEMRVCKVNFFLGFYILLKEAASLHRSIISDCRYYLLVTRLCSYFTCSACVHKYASLQSLLKSFSFFFFFGLFWAIANCSQQKWKRLRTCLGSIKTLKLHRKLWSHIILQGTLKSSVFCSHLVPLPKGRAWSGCSNAFACCD